MTVEIATTIDELDATLPDDTGTLGEGVPFEDTAHTRLIKDVLKKIFKGVGGTGFDRAILATEDEINFITGLSSNLQAQLTALAKTSVPIGGCIMYSGTFSSIPTNYLLCNGAGGTPNLTSDFVYGTNTEGQIEITGGSNNTVLVSHTHNINHTHTPSATSTEADHSHNVDYVQFRAGTNPLDRLSAQRGNNNPIASNPTDIEPDHTHAVTIDTAFVNTSTEGELATDRNIPPYLQLAYIQRQS